MDPRFFSAISFILTRTKAEISSAWKFLTFPLKSTWINGLSFSFLISAIATFSLYYSYERKFIFNIQNKSIVLLGLLIIICPIFFQLSGNIFLEEWGGEYVGQSDFHFGAKPLIYDHNNDLTKIPLPISILFCSFLIFLIGKYNDS